MRKPSFLVRTLTIATLILFVYGTIGLIEKLG